MKRILTPILRLANQTHTGLRLARREARQRLGVPFVSKVLPYRGFGTAQRVLVRARVLEDRFPVDESVERTLWSSAVASYKRYATWEVPRAPVTARWGKNEWTTQTDDEGFVELWVTPPEDCDPGWHEVELSVESHSVQVPVLVIGEKSQLGVISDIDDTVIETGVGSLVTRARVLFLTDRRERLPYAGVSEFYRALEQGTNGGPNPIFYVSSSPWNLHEHLETLMKTHTIPAGPLMLRDWGLSSEGFAPGGGHGHKLLKIRQVLAALPALKFLLIGDSGQEDAEHYRTIVRENPGRIAGVYIREVHTRVKRNAELEAIAKDIEHDGSVMVCVQTTQQAHEDAKARGWVRSA